MLYTFTTYILPFKEVSVKWMHKFIKGLLKKSSNDFLDSPFPLIHEAKDKSRFI